MELKRPFTDNDTVTYFMIHRNRSKKAFQELIQDWEGILVIDN